MGCAFLDFAFNHHIRREKNDPSRHFLRAPFFKELLEWLENGSEFTVLESFQRLTPQAVGLLLSKSSMKHQTQAIWNAIVQTLADVGIKEACDFIAELLNSADLKGVSWTQLVEFNILYLIVRLYS